MPNPWYLLGSAGFLLGGVLFFLGPNALRTLNATLNRTFTALDEHLMSHRYVVGLILFALSYSVFRLALLFPLR